MLVLLLALFIALPAAHARWNDCSLDDVVDTAAVPLLGDFWNTFVRNSSNLHIDSGTSLDQGRFFMRWAYILTKSDEMLEGVVQNCLFGVLTLLLQALPAVDYERGREEALSMLDMARTIFREASQMEDFRAIAKDAEEQGWEVQPMRHALQLYDFYLGGPELGGREREQEEDCPGGRVFVYPPPVYKHGGGGGAAAATRPTKKLLHDGSKEHYFRALAHGPLQCLFGMYGTEFLFHHFFRSSCAARDPSEADFFFVPSYFKCVEVINYVEHFNEEEDEADTLFRQTVAYIREFGPWFDRYDGADHIFLYSWGRFPCRLADWRVSMRSAIAVQVENFCEDLNTESPQPTFNRWKDVIIPGHIDQWRVLELKRWNLPFKQRDVLIAFHGRHAGNTDSYANVRVRSQIVDELESLPGVSVGGFIEGYHELLGQSIFCLAPRGITPWTIHLYVAMLAGCIPVILSDDYELPFQGLVDWPSFSLKWPMRSAGRELYNYLVSLDVRVMAAMKQKVDENACWFDYYSSSPHCSPFRAVTAALEERRVRRPTFAGRFWGPGGPEALPEELLSTEK